MPSKLSLDEELERLTPVGVSSMDRDLEFPITRDWNIPRSAMLM
jgi:hypothetical protein